MSEKREKFYTVSARLVFSSIMVIVVVAIVLGASAAINRGPIFPLLGVIGIGETPVLSTTTIGTSVNGTYTGNTGLIPSSVVVDATCAPTNTTFHCEYPYFNYSTGIFTVALSQSSGYNWTGVTVIFIPANTVYSHGVPYVSWSPPEAVNVTGGLLNDTTKYINVPISSGPVAVGTNITGTIWAKYQVTVGTTSHYANMTSAIIVVKR